jgi:hypothetical protein
MCPLADIVVYGVNSGIGRSGKVSRAALSVQANGLMFWFMRKRFFESYFVLSCWSRR